MNIWVKFGLISVVFGGLFGVGCLYNGYVAHQEARGHDEGFTAFFVVGGVLFTLIGIAIARAIVLADGVYMGDVCALTGELFLLDLGGFGASGLPMVWGSWRRYAQRRENGQRLYQR